MLDLRNEPIKFCVLSRIDYSFISELVRHRDLILSKDII